MAGEEDRKDLPEFLPIRQEPVDAEPSVDSSPQDAPEPPSAATADPPGNVPSDGASATGESPSSPAPNATKDVESGDADDSESVEPMPVVREPGLEPAPAAPTEPSHHYQVPLPENAGEGELEPGDGISRILGPPTDGQQRPRMPLTPPSNDRDRQVPSILVTVMLGYSRDMFEQAVEAAIQRATQKFHKIAKQEIDMFAFEQRAARRAADYRLRGPNPQ